MAKRTIIQRIKEKLFGGGKKKSTKGSSAPKRTKNEERIEQKNTGGGSFDKREFLNRLTGKDSSEKETRYKSMADAINTSNNRSRDFVKTSPPKTKTAIEDPKIDAAKKSRAEMRKKLDAKKQENKEWHEATNNRFNVNEEGISKEEKARRRQNIKSRAYDSRTAVKEAEHTMKWHGKEMSFARGALSGATFGASDLAAKKLTKGEAKKAEEVYQANKSKGWETAGEVVGSLASFGATAGATDALGEKVIEKAAPRAAEKLAGTKLIQGAAKRSVKKAVKKGAVEGATKELIEQVGKDKARKIVRAVGTDIAQNLTTGAIYDINKASTEYEWGSPEWWKELGKSAAFNAAITGAVAGGSMLTGGKRLATEAAETVANRARARQTLGEMAERFRASAGDAAKSVPPRLGQNADEAVETAARVAADNADEAAETIVRNASETAENAAESTARQTPTIRNEELHYYLNDEIVPYREKVQAFNKRVEDISAELDEAQRIADDVNLSETERAAASQRYEELVEETRQLNDDIAIAREQAGETADSVEAAIRNDEMGEPTRTVNDEIRESLDPEEQAAWTKAGDTERYTAEEAEEIKGQNWRTDDYHTKQGGTTVGVGMGDKKFRGAMEEAINNGDMTIEVYHDKENYEKGAQRILDYANGMGGESGKANLDSLAEKFERYAAGKEKINSKEARDMLYDILAAVDYANGMEDKALAERLFLSATKAGAELTSVSGLSLRQWHKIAMSSPDYRAKAVKQQIELMFNQSRGFRKKFGKIKGTLKKPESFAGVDEAMPLDTFIKENPDVTKDLKEALDTLENAKSKEEVEAAASDVLLEARKVMPVTAFDQLTQWRYVAMLSSPTTHIKNIVGNIYSGTLGQMSGAISSGIENHLIKSGKVNADEYLKSSSGLSWSARNDAKVGVGEGIKLNNLKEQLEKAKKQLAKADDKGLEAAQKKVADLEAKVAKAQQNFDNTSGKIKNATGAKAQELFHSKSRDSLINDATKWEMQHGGVSGKALGKASEVLSMALETSDAVAVERIYRETADKVLRANNYEEWVKRAAESSGKEAKAAKAKVKQIEEYAAQHGAYKAALDTYRNYNAVASWMNKTIKNTLYNADAKFYKKAGGFMLHAVMPFTKVPTNIVKRSLDYSPKGLLEGKKMLKKALDSGDYAEINKAVERISEGLVGTGIAGLGLGMGMLDPDGMTITTRLDRDDPLDKAKKDRGYMDYSVKLGDRDYTLEWATPTASTFFVGVEIGRMLRNAYDKIADGQGLEFSPWKAIETSGEIMTRAIEPALQLTMFQGANSVLEDSMENKYDEANINPIFRAMGNIASNYVSSMQPSVLNRLSRAFAPYDYYISGDTNAEYKKNLALSKIPIASEKMFEAKTDAWGNPKNTADTAGEKALKAGVTLFSPMNVSKVTWDDTDTKLYDLYEKTGDDSFLPKVFYDSQNKGLQLGRNKDTAIDIDLSNNDAAQYNIARGKAGEDAMSAALESVIFNRRTKDEKGISIPAEDAYTKEQKDALKKQFKGKGTKDVVKWVMEQPEYKNATELEQKKILKEIVGNGEGETSVGAKRASELTVAKRHNITEDEYDYRNEVSGKKQEELEQAIKAGILTYKDVVDFNRGAAKVGYYTEEDSGGYSRATYNRTNILEYLDSTDLPEDAKEALYNAYFTGKTPYGASVSRGGYRRGYRRYGGYRRRGGGGSKATVPKIDAKSMASSVKKATATKVKLEPPTPNSTKVAAPKPKFKKYEV